MKQRFVSIIILLLSVLHSAAQSMKTFDIFSYTAPSGFVLKDSKDKLFFQKTEGKNYCQLFLYPATSGQNDAEKDFTKTWDFFARNPSQKINDPETKEADSLNGWQTIFGAAKGVFNKQKFAIIVSTFTKKDITYYKAAVFTNEKYIPIAQEFFAGISAVKNKFVGNISPQPGQQNTNTSNTPTTGNSGITKSTTNFDDGWTSISTNDFVQVSKNETEVRLYYADATIDKHRPSNTNSFEGYYWDAIVKSAFNTGQPLLREKEQYSYGKEDIWEAAVTNKQTGKAGYLGMRLVFNNGACRPIVVIAPDKNSYYSLFGTDEDFTKMLYYNKFAVDQKDLAGKWKSFEASSIGYYSIYTGDYAGMATTSTNDEFVFNNNGTYQSTHTGTSTFNGSLAHGKSFYKGIYNVTDWHMTATNRGANDPGEFSCQFEAIKGGYMLRLVNKKFGGDAMTFFKSN